MWCSGFLLVRTDAIKKIAGIMGQSSDISLYGIVHSFLYPREGILPHLWFLPTLMLLCLISPILQSVSENKVRWVIVLVVTVVLTYCPLETNVLCIRDVKNYLFWYLLGIGSALHLEIDDLKNISNKVSYALLIILFASWSVSIFFTGNDGRLGSGLLSLSFLLLISSKIEWGGGTAYRKIYIPNIHIIASNPECCRNISREVRHSLTGGNCINVYNRVYHTVSFSVLC